MKEIKYVSDLISEEVIGSWSIGQLAAINAGTGQGKSHWAKNTLYEYARHHGKRILFLTHRVNCRDQFRAELERDNKTDIISIDTYQAIETKILNRREQEIGYYNYIVSDEFHYFIGDALFNNYTDLSMNYILSQDNSVRVFMSATGADMKSYIAQLNREKGERILSYSMSKNRSQIDDLKFFYQNCHMQELLDEFLRHKEKAIFFIQSASRAHSLFEENENYCIFNCSEGNDNYERNSTAIERILQTERLDEKPILITTTCMDAGVNIHDREIKHIVIDIVDTYSLIQAAGRRRIEGEDDSFNLYIRAHTNRELNGLCRSTQRSLEMANFLKDNGTDIFHQRYPRINDKSGVVYNDPIESNIGGTTVPRVNELRYKRLNDRMAEWRRMIEIGEYGYCEVIAQKFGKYGENDPVGGYTPSILSTEQNERSVLLERYLEQTPMYMCQDRLSLINGLNFRRNGRQLKRLTSLNAELEHRGYNYRIREFETHHNGRKYKNAWRVERHTY